MNELKLQNERLLKFADHLCSIKHHPGQLPEEVELVEVEERVRIHYKTIYDHLIIDELPAVFEEFYYNEINGDATFQGMDPEEGPIPGLIQFFGMTIPEFVHCFDIEGYQDQEKFGGKTLTSESGPTDIAFNLISLAKRRDENITR